MNGIHDRIDEHFRGHNKRFYIINSLTNIFFFRSLPTACRNRRCYWRPSSYRCRSSCPSSLPPCRFQPTWRFRLAAQPEQQWRRSRPSVNIYKHNNKPGWLGWIRQPARSIPEIPTATRFAAFQPDLRLHNEPLHRQTVQCDADRK